MFESIYNPRRSIKLSLVEELPNLQEPKNESKNQPSDDSIDIEKNEIAIDTRDLLQFDDKGVLTDIDDFLREYDFPSFSRDKRSEYLLEEEALLTLRRIASESKSDEATLKEFGKIEAILRNSMSIMKKLEFYEHINGNLKNKSRKLLIENNENIIKIGELQEKLQENEKTMGNFFSSVADSEEKMEENPNQEQKNNINKENEEIQPSPPTKKKKNFLNFFEKLANEVIKEMDDEKKEEKERETKEEEDLEESPYHKLGLSKFKRKAKIINSIFRPSKFFIFLVLINSLYFFHL